jgi:hypothetical protein
MSNTKARKLNIVRKPNEPIRLEPGEAVHVGVDVPKASSSVALFSDRRGLIAPWVQPARPEVLLERLRPLREGIAQVVYEAGPTGFTLARRLRAEGYTAQVIAPSKLLAPVGPGAKSDRLDCRRLAQLAAKGLLHPVRVPTAQEEADRTRVSFRVWVFDMAGTPEWDERVTDASLASERLPGRPGQTGCSSSRGTRRLCVITPANYSSAGTSV